jgi:hypothetical protein
VVSGDERKKRRMRERPSSLPGGAATLSSPATSTATAGGSMTTATAGGSMATAVGGGSMSAGAVGGSVVSVVVHPKTSGGHSHANKVRANSLYCKLLNS